MMKLKLYALYLGISSLLVLLACVNPARAALGGSVGSVESDRKSLSAVNNGTTAYNNYSVHEMYSASNTVREFVSQSGVVFGIAWNGLVPPDISQLLGSYYSEYKAALQHTPRQKGVRHQQVKAPGVVVERWGHMRNLQGRAYAPALIPPGVSIDEIR